MNIFNNHRLIYKKQIDVVVKMREEIAGLSNYLVGVDAAGGENCTEPWAFSPIYQNGRNSDSNKLLCNDINRSIIRSLGFTFHVGEEFRHLITGLLILMKYLNISNIMWAIVSGMLLC